jgi:1-acyl-sn-glycerol-3-phosphate acyltransferase
MRTIILFIFYVLITILLIPVLLISFLFGWSKPLIWAGKKAVGMGPLILGIRVEVKGRDSVDKDIPYIFMSNHLSFLDGPLLFWAIPQPVRVILKKEVFRIPVLGLGMRQVDFVPVDRKGIRGGKKSIERAVELIREKRFSFLIFPEGTRSRDGKLQAFRRGGFFLALKSQVPIIPISILGTFELMPKGSFFVKRGRIKIIFHAPVPVFDYSKDRLPGLSEKVRAIIRSGLKEEGVQE